MVGKAEAAGYAENRNLGRLFIDWQQRGLLGKAVTKTARQGGEGLWPDGQGDLWLALLRDRIDDGVSIETMANRPVASWLLGNPAITTGQAQLAALGWARIIRSAKPAGPRSARKRAIDARVDRVCAPGTSTAAKRELRAFLEAVNDGVRPSPSRINEVFADVADAVVARNYDAALVAQLNALEHFDELAASTPGVAGFWRWARGFWPETLPPGGLLPVADFLDFACTRLITVLGVGIALAGGVVAVPEGHPIPPELTAGT